MSHPTEDPQPLPRVAVLGTGTMGQAFAERLLERGAAVTVWNRTASRAAPLRSRGARVADEPADAVHDADVVITALFDARAVLDHAPGFLPAMPSDAVWLQTATVGRAGIAEIAAAAERYGVPLVDAPVLGTKGPAQTGRLTVLASAPQELLARVRPVLDVLGSRTVHVSDRVGDASALKLACNTWIATLTAGTAQSIALTQTFGLDPRLFLDAITGSASDSPYAQQKGAAMIEQRTGEAQFALDGLHKDLLLTLDAVGASSPVDYLAGLERLYARASDLGHGHDDIAAVFEAVRGTLA